MIVITEDQLYKIIAYCLLIGFLSGLGAGLIYENQKNINQVKSTFDNIVNAPANMYYTVGDKKYKIIEYTPIEVNYDLINQTSPYTEQ